ncbi:MAG: hypothetical protein V5A62_16160, partial [Haloarculaceae archaeon]
MGLLVWGLTPALLGLRRRLLLGYLPSLRFLLDRLLDGAPPLDTLLNGSLNRLLDDTFLNSTPDGLLDDTFLNSTLNGLLDNALFNGLPDDILLSARLDG